VRVIVRLSLRRKQASPDGSHHECNQGQARGVTVRNVSQKTGPRGELVMSGRAQATATMVCRVQKAETAVPEVRCGDDKVEHPTGCGWQGAAR
jgi:hypothetical protein